MSLDIQSNIKAFSFHPYPISAVGGTQVEHGLPELGGGVLFSYNQALVEIEATLQPMTTGLMN